MFYDFKNLKFEKCGKLTNQNIFDILEEITIIIPDKIPLEQIDYGFIRRGFR